MDEGDKDIIVELSGGVKGFSIRRRRSGIGRSNNFIPL